MTLDELDIMNRKGLLRGTELLTWGHYIEEGGIVFPTEMFDFEGTPPPKKESFYKKQNGAIHDPPKNQMK